MKIIDCPACGGTGFDGDIFQIPCGSCNGLRVVFGCRMPDYVDDLKEEGEPKK